MNEQRYAIRHIEPLSAFKFGLVVGGMVMLLPGFALGILVKDLVDLLVEMANAVLFAPDLGPITQLHQMGWGLVWLVMVGSVIFGAISGALAAVLGAVLYNLVTGVSGGIVVHADLLDAAAPYAGAVAGQVAAYVPAALPPPAAAPTPAHAAGSSYPGQSGATPAAALPPAAGKAHGGPALLAAGGSNEVWPLHGAVTMVGSAPSCDIRVAGLATLHAEIRLENGRYVLYDVSGGQTWVNDRQITTANLLKDGFRIRLGAENFLFQAPASP